MKKIAVVLLMAMTLCAGCSRRVVDFTLISSKNVDLSRMSSFERAHARVSGKDMAHIIIFFPTSQPHAKEAVDRAIETIPGAVALADGVLSSHGWYIPYIYGRFWYDVEGTPLIDPSLLNLSQNR